MRIFVLSVDPSETRTGVAGGPVDAEIVFGRLQMLPATRKIERLGSFRPRADGGFRDAMLEVASWVPAGLPWVPVIERPPPARFGAKASSIHAFKLWCAWVDAFARERVAAAGERYRRSDRSLLDPGPGDWRAPLGLPTRAPKGMLAPSARASWLKSHAVDYAIREAARFGPPGLLDGLGADDHDAAEALCIWTWAIRCVGSIGAWLRLPKGVRPIITLT